MAIQMDFEYSPQGGKRRVYRVLAPGLNVRISGHDTIYSIADLSVGGLAIRLPNDHRFEVGQEGVATFQIRDKHITPAITARVLRLDKNKNIAAFEFIGLSSNQEAMLDKLVLALQKHNLKQTKDE